MKIILSAFVALLLVGCGDNQSTTQKTKSEAVVQTEATQKTAVSEKTVATEPKVVAAPKVVATPEPVTTTKAATTPKTVATAAPTVDGAKLFVACASCHGAHAEKKALGKSQVIAGWQKSKIVDALQGYQAGTYGGAMKAVMQGQAKKLTNAEINAVAEYISKL